MKRVFAVLLLFVGLAASAGADQTDIVARVAFLSDTHVALRTNASGVLYDRHFEQAIQAANVANVDLVLIAGDVTDNGFADQMNRFKKSIKALKAPVLFVSGNHDIGHMGKADRAGTLTPNRVQLYHRNLGPLWFAKEKGGVRVIGISSCLFGTGYEEERAQWKFLQAELAGPHIQPTVLMQHYPVAIEKGDVADGVWNEHAPLPEKIIPMLKQGGVRAVLSGHLHRPVVNRRDGILFLSNGATAYGLPRPEQKAGWMLLKIPAEGEIQFEFRELE